MERDWEKWWMALEYGRALELPIWHNAKFVYVRSR